MLVYLSLLLAVLGAFAYALSTNAKVSEMGRLTFAVSLLAFLLALPHSTLRLP